MQLDDAIKDRKSVRHFSKKVPNWRDIIECIDAARYAPMAGNIFPLKFLVVDDPEIIKKLAEAAQQDFVGEAAYIVVVCTEPKLVLNAYQERADKFCKQQAGAAIENFLLKVEEKGLSTCWIGYFVDYLIREALNIPDGIEVEAMFPIGHESKEMGAKRKSRKKMELDKFLFFNRWKNKTMAPKKKMNV